MQEAGRAPRAGRHHRQQIIVIWNSSTKLKRAGTKRFKPAAFLNWGLGLAAQVPPRSEAGAPMVLAAPAREGSI